MSEGPELNKKEESKLIINLLLLLLPDYEYNVSPAALYSCCHDFQTGCTEYLNYDPKETLPYGAFVRQNENGNH